MCFFLSLCFEIHQTGELANSITPRTPVAPRRTVNEREAPFFRLKPEVSSRRALSIPFPSLLSARRPLAPAVCGGVAPNGACKARLSFRFFFLLTRTQLTVPNAHSPIRREKSWFSLSLPLSRFLFLSLHVLITAGDCNASLFASLTSTRILALSASCPPPLLSPLLLLSCSLYMLFGGL